MKIKIFGANLRDQSKGSFVVHACDCRDADKLQRIGEAMVIEDHASQLSVSASIWSDMIREESMTPQDGLCEIHFCPCAKLPVAA